MITSRRKRKRQWGLISLAMSAGCLLAGLVIRPFSPLDSWGLLVLAVLFLICAAIRRSAAAILDVLEPRATDSTSRHWPERLTNWMPSLRDEVDEDYADFVRSMQEIEESEQRPAATQPTSPATSGRRRPS